MHGLLQFTFQKHTDVFQTPFVLSALVTCISYETNTTT